MGQSLVTWSRTERGVSECDPETYVPLYTYESTLNSMSILEIHKHSVKFCC